MSMSLSAIIKVNGTPCCSNGGRRNLRCCMYHNTSVYGGPKKNPMKLMASSDFSLVSWLRDFSLAGNFTLYHSWKFSPIRLLKIIFLLMPPLLFKMIFQFCLIASVKLVFVTDIVDWDKGFFAYFLCPPSCSLKESRRLCRPPFKNVCKVPLP